MKEETKNGVNVPEEEVKKAREVAFELTNGHAPNVGEIMDYTSLEELEKEIKNLNDFSDKCWLISSLAIYTCIYNKELYTQSGLSWSDYVKDSKKRLGIEYRELYLQLSAARFFLKYYKKLIKKGWTPAGSRIKLTYAELAHELSGDLDATIDHVINDNFREFRNWYQSFRVSEAIPVEDKISKKSKIKVEKNKILIDGVQAFEVSDNLPQDEQLKYISYFKKILDIVNSGDEPAIISVYNQKEASKLEKLRDKERSNK